jgi:prepilin-type N-terminal cleavage/methylation domain-containing protein
LDNSIFKEIEYKGEEMKKAFTLLELMIIIAIIGLLSAIAIPNFIKAKERAEAQKLGITWEELIMRKQIEKIEEQERQKVIQKEKKLGQQEIPLWR